MDHTLKIIVRSNHFQVMAPDERRREMCFDYIRHNCLKVDLQGQKQTVTAFAAANKARTWFRFHINALEGFKNFTGIKGYNDATRSIVEVPIPHVEKIDIKVQDHIKLRAHQIDPYNYLMRPVGVKDKMGDYPEGTGSRIRMLPLSTGTGKTITASTAMAAWGYRPVAIVLAQFVGKWVKDFCAIWECTEKEILVVKGGANMQALTAMANIPGSTANYKAIIVSNRTFDNYLASFESGEEKFEEDGYECGPDELWQKLGVGIKLVDEVHMQYHSQFRVDLYTNVLLSISLSATLVTRDPMLKKMYALGYPPKEQFQPPPPVKYIDAIGVYYSVNANYQLRTSERGQSTYSHNAYEKSIMKVPKLMTAYADMAKTYLQTGYVKDYKPGDKAIIFCSTVEMCTKMTEKIAEAYPDFNVKRYVAADPYIENYKDPDIRITTIGSGGTGHDVPGLTCNIKTVNIDSLAANVQAMGRLRELPDGRFPRFYFFSNRHVPKHITYHNKKLEMLRDRARTYETVHHPRELG